MIGTTGGTGGTTAGTGGSTGGTGGVGGSTGGTGGSTGGSAGSEGGTAGTEGSMGGTGGGGGPACDGTLPTTLVPVSGGYSIDATEVTRCQYDVWLATSPSTSGQASVCTWNDSYEPSCEWPPGTKGDHPVVCVEWCDAYAYCQAVGKRLCGKIGGGMNALGSHANASTSQWHAVCSSGGANDYPYGDTYAGITCNGIDRGWRTTVPVGYMSGCQSSVDGYAGVYDLSGNVWEWEDSCAKDAGASDACRVRGGSLADFAYFLTCANDWSDHPARALQHNSLGFRCCSSP